MSSIKTLIDAYIKRNANQEITGPVLNGVLTAIADALGTPFIGEDGYWYEYDQETGEYVSSGTPAQGESGVNDAWAAVGVSPDPQPLPSVDVIYDPTLRQLAFTFYDIQGPKGDQGTPGITGASVSVDANVGTPSVDASIVNSILTLAFHNLRGAAAGFGTPTISVGANQGTPSASVTASGPDTAKVFNFAFDGLKGETGPQGPQGPQGNPGSSQDYPFTLANNLTTDDSTVALTAAMGVQLEGEVSQLESEVEELDQELNGTSTPFSPTWQRNGYYINPQGGIVAYNTWSISYPFILKKGQTIEVKTQGSGVCIIAATTDGATYSPLVNAPSGTSGLNTYSYSAKEDISIAVCAKIGIGDVTMRTYMVDVRSSVYDLNDAFKTIGEHQTITASQSVSSGGRLNKSVSLAQYVGQIAKIKVTKTGGSTTVYRILYGNSSIGSAFNYGDEYQFMVTQVISSIIFYGSSTESSTADFSIVIEIKPNYGIEDIDKKMFFSDTDYSGQVITGKYINTNNQNKGNPTDLSGAGCVTGPINPGDILVVSGEGPTQYVGLYAFYDASNRKILSSSNAAASKDNPTQIFAPEGSASFVYNSSPYSADTTIVTVRKVFVMDDLKKEVDEMGVEVDALSSLARWKGKTVVCFGDSMTEFTDPDGKRYSDYLESLTGATVINVGIGGTRISCRATPVTTPTNSLEGYAALDCASLIDAVANNDFTIVDAGAAWVRDNAEDDNTPAVARLKSIDWTKVDAVTFFIGTNDWGGEANIGTSGEVNKRTVLGAIDFIVSNLLSAYPNVQIYWFTPIVRWITPWTDENWGGTMQKAGRTLEQFVGLVKDEVETLCIPVCDMYHTLGWNKYNFGQYFYSTDGTHPTKGYANIGRKMASFISSMRTF